MELSAFDRVCREVQNEGHRTWYPLAAVAVAGVQWARHSGRVGAEIDLYLRYLDRRESRALLQRICDDCSTMGDVPRWLNTNLFPVARDAMRAKKA